MCLRQLLKKTLFSCLIFETFFVSLNAKNISNKEMLASAIEKEVAVEIGTLEAESRKSKKFRRRLEARVKREIEWQNRKLRRQAAKDKLAGRVRLHNVSRFRDGDFFYKIPAWPFSAVYYAEKDLVEFNVTLNGSSKAFSSSGDSQDISKLVFGEERIELKDILLASKLLKDGILEAKTAHKKDAVKPKGDTPQFHFLYALAEQPIDFDASMNSQRYDFNYARHFKDGDISFGFQMPIVRRENNFRLDSDIDDQKREELARNSPAFFELFRSLEKLVEEIVTARNVTYNKRDTEMGFGDIFTFINVEIASRYFERIIIGGKLLFPTANDKQTDVLWHPDLGNGGYVQYSLFAGFMKSYSQLFNPHVFVDITGSVPATVSRRVPIKKVYDGSSSEKNVGDFLTLGGTKVQFSTAAFSEYDTFIRHFPSTVKAIKIRPGPQFFVRIGNVFEKFFYRKSFLDVFYDLRVKGADYLGQRRADNFNPSILTNNTFQLEHRLGFNYDYQFSGRKRLNAGFLFSVAGRNTPINFEGNVAFSLEF